MFFKQKPTLKKSKWEQMKKNIFFTANFEEKANVAKILFLEESKHEQSIFKHQMFETIHAHPLPPGGFTTHIVQQTAKTPGGDAFMS